MPAQQSSRRPPGDPEPLPPSVQAPTTSLRAKGNAHTAIAHSQLQSAHSAQGTAQLLFLQSSPGRPQPGGSGKAESRSAAAFPLNTKHQTQKHQSPGPAAHKPRTPLAQ